MESNGKLSLVRLRNLYPRTFVRKDEHTHESWTEYRECYAKLSEKYAFRRELHALRGDKTHELC